MIAGVVDKVVLAAVRTAINLPAQSAGAAGQDGLHGPAMGGKNGAATLPFVLRPGLVRELGQGGHRLEFRP
jgi:hypothetical protein